MEKKPHLLILSALPLATGGIEQHLLYLLAAARTQYRITLLSPALPEFLGRLQSLGVDVISWRVSGYADLHALWDLRHVLHKCLPDLVHIHDARAGFLGRLLIKLLGIPVVYTIHLPSYFYWRETPLKVIINKLYAAMESVLNRLATDRVIYIGRLTFEDAIKRSLVPSKKAVLIENGIDLQPFRLQILSDVQNLREQSGVPKNIPVICSVARLTVQKNLELLIRAAACLKENGIFFRLWLVGDGPDRKNLEALVDSLNLQHEVFFWGTRPDIPNLLAASDVFVLPSRYEGGRTLSVMEAQAAGKPCVVTDVGDHRFMVENGVHGFVVPVDDLDSVVGGLSRILSDPESMTSLGAASREQAFSSYDVDLMTRRVLEVYKYLHVGKKTS
ncbi:MAG: glycosyltransferase family 4 protein [Chloroflexi bacterium]|nr:glycosyltransferase family 4 protein [Chloroflexota bacterium]